MTDQLRISDSGEIEVQPLSTMRELFNSEAFRQLRGQTTMEVGSDGEES